VQKNELCKHVKVAGTYAQIQMMRTGLG